MTAPLAAAWAEMQQRLDDIDRRLTALEADVKRESTERETDRRRIDALEAEARNLGGAS